MFQNEKFALIFAVIQLSSQCLAAYYLPGVTPVPFQQGEPVTVDF